MAFVIADRVRETTSSIGTTAVTLGGAYVGFQAFSAAIGNSNSTYYAIANVITGEWEVGIGTYSSSGNTLSRDTVLGSSNGGALVSFTSGSKDVFVTQPAERAVYINSAGTSVVVPSLTDSALTAGRVTYASTAGLLADSANLTFNGTTLAATGLNITGDTALGDASNDTVSVNGTVTSNIVFTDNTYDIGASGVTRPRTLYLGTSLVTPAITDSGDLTFTGTGNRITGDFSNATIANRVMFQNSTTNGGTFLYVLPNGTSTSAGYTANNNSTDPDNASEAFLGVTSTAVVLNSNIRGTGTYLPTTFNTGGSERVRVTTNGGVAFGGASNYGTTGQALVSAGDLSPVWTTQYLSISFIIDGGGVTITTGIKGDLTIPFACTIQEWTLLADQSGSVVVDIWKDTYANYPPTVADTITGSALPTITTATKGQSSTLTGWTTTIAAGDTLRFNVNSATTITRVTLSLKVYRT